MWYQAFLIGLLTVFLPITALEATDTSSCPPSSVLPQNTTAVKSSSGRSDAKKSSPHRKKIDNTDYWCRCEKVKGKLFKDDLDDSVYPKEPIMTDLPGYKP